MKDKIHQLRFSGRRHPMKKQYRFIELSKGEREYHEMILMEEIEVQSWYAITYSCIFAEEVFLTVQ
jgi:hypothetical protein